MFTSSDAAAIRRGLGEIDFTAPLAEPLSSAFELYFDFYRFDSSVIGAGTSHAAGIIHAAGFEVVAQYFQPVGRDSQGTVVLLHGYFDHSGIYQHIIKHCLDQNFAVVVFDMPGHGLSSGKVASIESF
jgi:hypothetical protein